MQIDNLDVSYFDSVTSKNPTCISVEEVFTLIQGPRFSNLIEQIRNCSLKPERDKLKKMLPAITVSGTFKGGHAKNNLVSHSGIIQIDFDNIEDPEALKGNLSKDEYSLACFISPSGNGVKVLVKIPHEFHLESFQELKKYYFNKYGIQIDEKCKDVCRLMFLSYDKDLHINRTSEVFDPIENNVNEAIVIIESQEIDLTDNYDNWLKIGFAFARQFNEDGRDYFHRISQFHPEYDPDRCNDQYNRCLSSEGEGITIKTFFHILNLKISPSKASKKNRQKPPDKANKTSKFVIVEEYLLEKYEFRYNEVSNEIEYRSSGGTYEPVNENNIYIELQRQNINFSQNNLTALLRSDFVPTFNPILEYFQGLPQWDETTDHILSLCSFIKAKDQDRFNRHFKKMLVRCIACALGASFNKQAFILTGGQSSGKTTLCRWLCADPLKKYYTENISTDKDSLISLAENFIINLDELQGLQRFEINALKSMLSRDSVKVRRPYDKKPELSKRRANFLGSTNKDEFLTDETGSVRWLCFELSEILWNYKTEVDINLVWGQAFSLFKSGFKYDLTHEEIEENERANAKHQVLTAEMELLQEYFEPSEKGKPLAEPLTATGIVNRLKTVGLASMNISNYNMGRALRHLGYVQSSERTGQSKVPTKVYWVRFNPPTFTTTPGSIT